MKEDNVAKKITELLKGTDRFAKTIAFCCDIEHAEGMSSSMKHDNADLRQTESQVCDADNR